MSKNYPRHEKRKSKTARTSDKTPTRGNASLVVRINQRIIPRKTQ